LPVMRVRSSNASSFKVRRRGTVRRFRNISLPPPRQKNRAKNPQRFLASATNPTRLHTTGLVSREGPPDPLVTPGGGPERPGRALAGQVVSRPYLSRRAGSGRPVSLLILSTLKQSAGFVLFVQRLPGPCPPVRPLAEECPALKAVTGGSPRQSSGHQAGVQGCTGVGGTPTSDGRGRVRQHRGAAEGPC
jgi:hypothetical protein